jgi:hypothetical protein
MRKKWYFFAPLAILAMVLFAFIGGEVVLHLWNWLLPPLFGWRQLTFWQALGLLALCRILFGHHGWRGPGRSNFRNRMRARMNERCGRMTPEEREKFRQAMRERWDFGSSPSESQGQQS